MITNADVKTISTATILHACHIAATYHFSYYNSLTVATALENNCNILYSEDMQHSQIIENEITILNPFR